LYRGEQFDSDLGLYYLRARWYNPATGRFMTRDPYQGSIYDPASLHRYNYAHANPANFIDPSGRASAAEYVLLNAPNAIKAGFLITLSQRINCQYFAIASTVGIIGQHIGEHIEGLDTVWHSCDAGLTASGFGKDLLINSATAFAIGAAFDFVAGQLAEFVEGEGAEICGNCFAAGTPVHTDHGSIPIEQIKVGDKVWAHNEKTGDNELRAVTAIAPKHRDKLLELRIEGEKDAIRATPSHPFYARANSSDSTHWIQAGDLVIGEQIETQGGKWVAVQSVTAVEGLSVVYNFTVEQDHDYFVGDEGLLVHNGRVCAWVENGVLKIRNKFPPGSDEDVAFRDFVDRWNQQAQNDGPLTRQAVTPTMRAAADAAAQAERVANPDLYQASDTAAGHTPDVGWGGDPNGPFTPLPSSVNSYVGGATQAVPPGTGYSSVEIEP